MAKFHKKVYCKLDSSPFSESINLSRPSPESEPKKIIPTGATKGVREDFKKTFLPLLIDVFELRQMIDNYKTQMQNSGSIQIEMVSKSPQEILERLEQLQKDIEESQRWCDGVILQLSKGIKEAKEALALVNGVRAESLLKRLLRKFKR
ncbi:MAG: hypothetical protein K1060chlam2_00672 [Chlamydiae bacterium]|nr:hypothetical protein [Chlamydiota bacterium]